MAIVPDEKDWTWVLDRRCPQCGFDAAALSRESVPKLIRDNARAWTTVLGRESVRVRPSPDSWSDLEYGCHVRDVCDVFCERLELMLAEDDPVFANWDQDATAVADRYELQDPQVVTGDLGAAGERLASRYDAVKGAQWSRGGVRSNGSRFTVETLAAYCSHDLVHHLWDVGFEERA